MILRESRVPVVKLSRRERELSRLMAEGMSYSQIAPVLGWQPESVAVYAHRLAYRLPGTGSPVVKILRWWFTVECKDS